MSSWRLEFDKRAEKDLKRLGVSDRRRVQAFLDDRVLALADQRGLGKAMTGPLAGLWTYRLGDIRIIARIEDRQLIILVVAAGNRGDIYR